MCININIFLTFLAKGTCQPKKEVVSIYNENFKTPPGWPPYFIKVSRCVQCLRCWNANTSSRILPVPATKNLTKVVVANSPRSRYFEYSIYNHTSCKCGNKRELDTKAGRRRKGIAFVIPCNYFIFKKIWRLRSQVET